MRNGGFIRGGRKEGKREHSCHTSIRPTLGKPSECKWVCCWCLNVLVPLHVILGLCMFVWGGSKTNKCLCMCVCVPACTHVFANVCCGLPSPAPLSLAIYPSDCPSAHLSLWLLMCESNQEVFKHFDGPVTNKTDQFRPLCSDLNILPALTSD